MNYVINMSKSLSGMVFASVFVAVAVSTALPIAVNAITYSQPKPCCSSTTYTTPTKTSTTYSTPVQTSTTYSTPVKSSTTYTTPTKTSTTYSTPVQTSTTYSTPVKSSTTYTTPTYTSTTYSTPVNTSTTYATPVKSSTTYTTPTYSNSTYSTPTYTTSSYSTPSYSSGSYSYSTPSYTTSYSNPSYSSASYSYSTPSYTTSYTPPESLVSYNPSSYTPPVYQPVCYIYANPNNVAYNGSTTLIWQSDYATSASLSSVGAVAVDGSYVINNITNPQTYTLTVTGQGGTATCMTQVTVQTPQPPVCQIYANPSSVQSGDSTTLTWTATNATTASLSEVGAVPTNGTFVFNNLTHTKTYTLTVTGQGGTTNTCTTTVNVHSAPLPPQAPYCTLTITPNTININQSATISWTAANATSATIDGIGSVNPTSGSQTIYPGSSRSYTMRVYGANGQSNVCTGYVNVQQQPTQNLYCTITANPSQMTVGGSSLLTWTSTGAVSASISDGLGPVATNGSLTVRPEASRYYVLTVRDYVGNTQTCSTNLSVVGSTYISLTQIPYTGFDGGILGNTLYWAVLLAGAGAAAYFVTLYRGGILSYAFGLAGARSAHIARSEDDEVEEESVVEEEEEGDAMTLQTVNGVPRLSINRVHRSGTEGLPGQN